MSKYAKRHYIDVARIIAETQEYARMNYANPACYMILKELRRKFIYLFRQDNPAFNADKFVNACDKKADLLPF